MVYKNIERLCTEKGLSIRSVERDAGLGNGTISKWETSSPSIKNLTAVAEVLGVSPYELMEGGDEERT